MSDAEFENFLRAREEAVQIGKMPQITNMRIRVTELFRKIDGEWQLIHRYADMPPR